MWYSNLETIFICRRILHQHWYTCPIVLPVRRNPQRRRLLTCLGHFRTRSGIIYDFWTSLREFLITIVNRFTRQTILDLSRTHFFHNILLLGPFAPRKRTADHCTSGANRPTFIPSPLSVMINASQWRPVWGCGFDWLGLVSGLVYLYTKNRCWQIFHCK
jgi:hypothetical protein